MNFCIKCNYGNELQWTVRLSSEPKVNILTDNICFILTTCKHERLLGDLVMYHSVTQWNTLQLGCFKSLLT